MLGGLSEKDLECCNWQRFDEGTIVPASAARKRRTHRAQIWMVLQLAFGAKQEY
ncbi:hypothetical protein L914_19971 [Phytophthora nicotianae]|uniref:Uncharacterized protein n=1 Tax=Phytophthora nicotianae TaxID=4792 RepID=W2MAW4_PHYNI|nr:hypothetical protein L914_19971 [Phytophthora nicotianae]